MKLRQGNVFTPVCHSVHRVLSAIPPGRHPQADSPLGRPLVQTPSMQTPPRQTPLGRHPQADSLLGRHPLERHRLPSACWDMVNKQVVHILLECILVTTCQQILICCVHWLYMDLLKFIHLGTPPLSLALDHPLPLPIRDPRDMFKLVYLNSTNTGTPPSPDHLEYGQLTFN